MSKEVRDLVIVELKKVLGLNKSISKREATEKVKLQAVKQLGSRVEKAVLEVIEEVWTDMHSMFNEETG